MSTQTLWYNMIQRCHNEKHPKYPGWGGLGVRVCERWHRFENFLADMGEKPEGLSIDRYPNNNGNYEPGNCRWATPTQQNRNARNNKKAPDGELWRTKAERNGISPALLHRRVHIYGWSWERASADHPDQNLTGESRGMQSNNTSGFKGVSFRKDRGTFIATITQKGKTFRLGSFSSAELANAAMLLKSAELHKGNGK